jgi:hypothetical protein
MERPVDLGRIRRDSTPNRSKDESPTPPDRGGESGSRGPAIIDRTSWRVQLPEIHPRVTARPYPHMSMVDQLAEDLTPDQAPTLTELEEARAGVELARHVAVEGLMASDDPADVGELPGGARQWAGLAPISGVQGSRPGPVLPGARQSSPGRGPGLLRGVLSAVGVPRLSPQLVASTVGVWGGTTGRGRQGLRRSVA